VLRVGLGVRQPARAQPPHPISCTGPAGTASARSTAPTSATAAAPSTSSTEGLASARAVGQRPASAASIDDGPLALRERLHAPGLDRGIVHPTSLHPRARRRTRRGRTDRQRLAAPCR
jgi:hypothetical protein